MLIVVVSRPRRGDEHPVVRALPTPFNARRSKTHQTSLLLASLARFGDFKKFPVLPDGLANGCQCPSFYFKDIFTCKRFLNGILSAWWLGSRVVSVLDSGAEGPGFKSQPRCCRVTVLGKLFTPIVPLFTKQGNW